MPGYKYVYSQTSPHFHPPYTYTTTTGLISIAGFGLPPGCRVPRPCTALIVHGTEDNYVPYDLSPQVNGFDCDCLYMR